jgi:hypothetical protein
MHMTIQQAGDNMAILSLDYPCLRSDGVTRVLTYKGNAFPNNRNGGSWEYFPGLNAYPATAAYDDIRRGSAHGDINE